jgi:hypothetical protein
MADKADQDEPERPVRHRASLTAEQAAHRIELLQRVYDDGYLSRDLYESMKCAIAARIERTD